MVYIKLHTCENTIYMFYTYNYLAMCIANCRNTFKRDVCILLEQNMNNCLRRTCKFTN